ncbi:MAG: hypothetical protein JSU70_11515 [Phycisphaerales bacterium]|nr:MAG: hypothetical protein JSU70_11515 [Phycisphaerales bacterium]
MRVRPLFTKDYEEESALAGRKNKAKTKPIQHQETGGGRQSLGLLTEKPGDGKYETSAFGRTRFQKNKANLPERQVNTTFVETKGCEGIPRQPVAQKQTRTNPISGRCNPSSESWVKDYVTSPCIDLGDPDSDWTAELWPHGKRINMGA